ncbi:Actin-related protein 2/3 complex subunit 1A [Striga hermonthica]|uniref:Actin-related protein C1 n=1 Tax=Striga hermonthica TaxID=68872 RepID=A0A9N7RD81_STRHE|nr:Actin-related protein 2/3 complex subunit 1A [Striga hermonthica]
MHNFSISNRNNTDFTFPSSSLSLSTFRHRHHRHRHQRTTPPFPFLFIAQLLPHCIHSPPHISHRSQSQNPNQFRLFISALPVTAFSVLSPPIRFPEPTAALHRGRKSGFISYHLKSKTMAAVSVHQFAQCITCHAWSPDHSMIAFCPNNNEVHIYQLLGGKWEKIHVLQKHDQIVSGIDWGVGLNRIVSVAHDRNSYVWSLEASEWVPTLVILRLNRAALCVQWSPKENKFAVGSGAKTVCICYYEQENNWWVSKIIRKRHDSSVTSVAWHPNNILLATTSTDGKCRVFSTFIKGVDTKNSTGSSDSKFGEQIMQLDLSFSWTFGITWSPHGNTLAYVGHNSMIYFVDDVGPSPSAQSLTFRDLPLRDVLFVSERMLIGVGFDCNPMVFVADERGLWSFLRFLDDREQTPGAKYGLQRSGTFGKFYSQSKTGSNDESSENSRKHDNCITSIVALKDSGDTTITSFSTSGLDGKIIIWDLQREQDLVEYL